MADKKQPFEPSFFNKINAVTKFIQNPCFAPWTVYFETAFPALGKAILALLDFGLGDVVRGALRPRGLRSHKHLKRGRSGKGRGKGLPELGNLLGANLPGSRAARGRQTTQGVKNLWIVDGVLQRLLWWWLVIDITNDFFFNWSSAIMASEFCQDQGSGFALAESPQPTSFFSVGNIYTSIPTAIYEYQSPGVSARFAAHWNNGKPFTAVSSIKAHLVLGTTGFLEILEIDENGNETTNSDGEVDDEGETNMVSSCTSGGGTVFFKYRTNGGIFEGTASSFTAGG